MTKSQLKKLCMIETAISFFESGREYAIDTKSFINRMRRNTTLLQSVDELLLKLRFPV